MDRPRPVPALLLSALSAGGAALAWLLAHHTEGGRALDRAGFDGFRGLDRGFIAEHAPDVVRLVDPGPFVLLGAALICVALARGRLRTAVVAAAVLAGANLTTQALKPVLGAVLDPALAPTGFHASWPSGHATAGMSLALVLVLVSPARLRPVAAAVSGLAVVGLVYCLVAVGSHLPSDVVGGFGVAAAWACLGVAGSAAAESRWPARAGREAAVRLTAALAPPVIAATAAVTAAVALAALRPEAVFAYAQAHPVFVVGAVAIGALGLALLTALAVLLRR